MHKQMLAAVILALVNIGGVAVVVRADAPPPPTRRASLFDQLDDARINGDLLEMEVAADKTQIQKMMTILRESELMAIQGFSQGPIVGGGGVEREANLEKYKKKLDHVCRDFVIKSKELSRERRRAAELEAQLGLTTAVPQSPAGPAPARTARSLEDAERVLDLILRGVESWQRVNPPALDERSTPPRPPSPAPEDRPLKDAERILDLIRKGIESWQRDGAVAPEGRPEPRPEPDQSLLKDAERLLDLLRRGVATWQDR